MATGERIFFQPFPNIPWDRQYGEFPSDLPTPATTVLFDPLERAIMGKRRLLQAIEVTNLDLPPNGTGTVNLVRPYELVSGFLTADRSKERHQAKRHLEKLLESDSEALLLSQLLEAQTSLPSQLAEIKAKTDEQVKPPTNFRVLGIFQPHRLETIAEGPLLKSQLINAGRQFFRKEDDNVVFLEDAYGHFYQNKDFYDALKAYGSIRKAFSFIDEKNHMQLPQSFSQLSKKQRDIVDELIVINGQVWDSVAKDPESDPEKAYMWTQFEAIDELIQEDFPIRVLWENGQTTGKWLPKEDSTTPEELIKIIQHNLSLLDDRSEGEADKTIAQQVTDLEKNKDKTKQTNLIMIFGSNHIAALNYLPRKLLSVTTPNFRP